MLAILPAVLPTRNDIDLLQATMATMPQLDLITHHHFADGMYLRELHIPKGCTLVGKVHKREHFCLLVQGEIAIVTEQGKQTLKAPAIFVSAPGFKRAGHALEDAVFINVHRTEHTDLNMIESELIEEEALALYDASNIVRRLP